MPVASRDCCSVYKLATERGRLEEVPGWGGGRAEDREQAGGDIKSHKILKSTNMNHEIIEEHKLKGRINEEDTSFSKNAFSARLKFLKKKMHVLGVHLHIGILLVIKDRRIYIIKILFF